VSDPFIAEIRIVGFNFPPRGWATCDGQLLPIAQNTALFSLIGTYYGGDGRTTFALPNLGRRTPLSAGQGPGLSSYDLGEPGGTETVTLTTATNPVHQHGMQASGSQVLTADPAGNVLGARNAMYMPSGTGILDPNSVALVGGSAPHTNRQPYLVMNYVIALQGVYPKRP
jgi:microcystin-dependent protein